jgi:ribosome modulation factor
MTSTAKKNAYDTGVGDYIKGIPIEQNPYPLTFLRTEWNRGWQDAEISTMVLDRSLKPVELMADSISAL